MDAVVGNSYYFDFEVRLMEALQGLLGEKGAVLLSQLSALGETLIFIMILGFLYWGVDKKAGIKVGTGLMFALCLNPMVKNIANRRRPYFDNTNVKCIRPVEKDADIYDIAAQGFSFPSGHSTNSVVVYGGIARCYKNKLIRALGVILPVLVGLSRIIAGVHYPTDVLCGWALGLVVILIVPVIFDKAGDEKRWLVFLILSVISLLGVFYCKTDDYFTGLGMMLGFSVAVEIEERFIKFESTNRLLEIGLRLVLGAAIFSAITSLLKIPFPSEVLERGDFLAHLIRVLRYFIASVVSMGVYPACFKKMSGLFNK